MSKPLSSLLGLVTLAISAIAFAPLSFASPPIEDRWVYTTEKPQGTWTAVDYDASGWKTGFGGFGTRGTPESRIGTRWNTPDIWLRKSFKVESVPSKPALYVHHDEDVQIYLNGSVVATKKGYTTKYVVIPIDASQHSLIKAGENLLAVHCHQTGGGQFIDVHLIDADSVPQLPPAQGSDAPFKTHLTTEWGEKVTPENAWQEYPRPQLERKNWTNLNGSWNYAISEATSKTTPTEWAGKILVPFSLESSLGGVQRLLSDTEALWYQRTFEAKKTDNQRTLINFEAVDYSTEVFVNGKSVGTHVGGSTPFTFDITEAIKDGSNELVVRVEDKTMGFQLQGKQRLDPHGIWYTRVSGIWQTVWLEQVSKTYIEDLTIQTDSRAGSIKIRPDFVGDAAGKSLKIVVRDGDKVVVDRTSEAGEVKVSVNEPKLWTPDTPHLYDIELTLLDSKGATIDHVKTYAGIRTVGRKTDRDGHHRLTLNDKPIFHWGPLDQGWWPDGLLTPPSDEAMLFDIEYLKEAGFNMIRKHIKVEPRRYYYHCDRIGMLVWQDQVSGAVNPPWVHLADNPEDATWPDDAHQQYMLELERMVDLLENHPSIVVWVPFNEAWGQHRTVEVGKWIVQRDPSRQINIASGGNFWPVGDIADQHAYPAPSFPLDDKRFEGFVKVVGEFGGHGFPIVDHLWDKDANNWGYGSLPKTEAEYRQRYVDSLNDLIELKKKGIAGGVYTQTTDVEGEINGLMTYDRRVIKIPASELKVLHDKLLND